MHPPVNALGTNNYVRPLRTMSNQDKYKEALRRIHHIDLGVFVTAVLSGPGAYTKRSDYQEGWNAAVLKQSEEEERILKELGIDDAELD